MFRSHEWDGFLILKVKLRNVYRKHGSLGFYLFSLMWMMLFSCSNALIMLLSNFPIRDMVPPTTWDWCFSVAAFFGAWIAVKVIPVAGSHYKLVVSDGV
jgi:hypothetical protein